ncbi:hypothetical protein F5X96DRAFT_648188 [Biscogniauxia mediterranea]|nr:hypothetical protein F5X96DRAFT_648188 [Biscogniauxia mediterranea]
MKLTWKAFVHWAHSLGFWFLCLSILQGCQSLQAFRLSRPACLGRLSVTSSLQEIYQFGVRHVVIAPLSVYTPLVCLFLLRTLSNLEYGSDAPGLECPCDSIRAIRVNVIQCSPYIGYNSSALDAILVAYWTLYLSLMMLSSSKPSAL